MANIRNLAALAALGAAGAMAMRDRKDKKAPVEDREKPKDKAETKPVAAAREDAAAITSNRDEAEAGLSGYTDSDRVANQLSAQQNKGITTNARGEAVPMRRAAPRVAPAAAPVTPAAAVVPTTVAPAVIRSMPPRPSVTAANAEAARQRGDSSGFKSYEPPSLVDQIPKKKGGMIKKMASGGSVSARGDGIAQRGKTKGRFV
jgi:hypothetical protein